MKTRSLVLSGLFIALGVVLPLPFHFFGSTGGKVLLPMHYATYFAGFILGPGYGFAVGMLTPIISHLVTGMPPMQPPVLPYMVIEMAIYGLVIGLVGRRMKNIFLPLLSAMVIGRVVMLGALYLLIPAFKLPVPPWVYFKAGFITSIPGILVQLVLLPLIFTVLQRRLSLSGQRFTTSDRRS
jgi:uncharacterized membrane protein